MQKNKVARDKDPFSLKGKVCVMVGGAGLMGNDFSYLCAMHGATVVIVSRDKTKGESLVKRIVKAKGKAHFEQCDVTSRVEVEALVKCVLKRFKRVDGLVNAAHFRGPSAALPVTDVSHKDFVSYLADHIGGPFLVTREFAKVMKKQKSGSIVLFSSIYGVSAPRFELPGIVRGEYAIAKAGLIMLSRYLAKYLGPSGIRVNTISPGAVLNNHSPSFVKEYSKHAVLGNRLLNPQDISPTVVYLLSEASRQVTGQNVVIDGGWIL